MWRFSRGPAGVSTALLFAAAIGSGLVMQACDDDGVGPTKAVVASISIDPPTAPPRVIAPGTTVQLVAIAKNAEGDDLDVTFSWTSEDPAVATVDKSGLVTALTEGVVTITASVQQQSASTTIIVQIPGALVVVDPAAAVLDRGATLQLAATVLDADGNVLDRPVTFTSEDPAVATVDATGLVTGVSVGEATIMATADELFGAAIVTVEEPVFSIELTQDTATLSPTETIQLAATPRDGTGRALNRPVQWSTSDPAVVTVDATGKVTAVGLGNARVTASAGGKQGQVDIVVQVAAAAISITSDSHGSEPLMIGATRQLIATVTDAAGNILNRPVTWASDATGIADVDQNGLVTGIARGSASITATSGSVSASTGMRVTGEGEETTGNNLSVPVVFAEGVGVTGELLTVETGLRPTAAEGITVDALPFFFSGNTPDCGTGFYCQGGPNVWQAEWVDGSTLGLQSADVGWGDNLTHHQWTTHSMIRVEIRMTAPAVGPLAGYNMPYSVGEGADEIQGTDGTTAPMVPNIYAVTPRLIIQKLDNVTLQPVLTVFDGAIWEAFGTDGPGGFSAEVNVGGAVIYGYNLQIRNISFPADIHKYGWWRLIFVLDDAGQVGGATIPRNVSLDRLVTGDDTEPLLFTPMLDSQTQMTWLDIDVKSSSGGGGGGGGH